MIKLSLIKISKIENIFLIIIGVLYFFAFLLHLGDVFSLRLDFSSMDLLWKSWIIYLLILDFLTALLLYKKKFLGEVFFIVVAVSQLIAYMGFKPIFGNQEFLTVFHILCLLCYFSIKLIKSHTLYGNN